MKKFLSILIAISLVISMLPVAFADGAEGEPMIYNLTHRSGDSGNVKLARSASNYESEPWKDNVIERPIEEGSKYYLNARYFNYEEGADWKVLDVANDIITGAATQQRRFRIYEGGYLQLNVAYDSGKDVSDARLKIALALKAPQNAGFYVPAVKNDTTSADNKKRHPDLFLDKVSENKDLEDYTDDSNKVGKESDDVNFMTTSKSAIYTTSLDEIVIALDANSSVYGFSSITLTPILDPIMKTTSNAGSTLSFDLTDGDTANDSQTVALSTKASGTLSGETVEKPVSNNFITYKSSKPEVATVAVDGTITAVGDGTATIYAESSDGKYSSVKNGITVTVVAPSEEPEENEPLVDEFVKDEEKADITDSYVVPTVTAITLNGQTIEAEPGDNGSYNFTAPATKDDNKFLYWAMGLVGNKRIVSFSETLENYLPEGNYRNYLVPVYEGDVAADKKEFYNQNGQLIPNADETTTVSMPGYGSTNIWKQYGETNIYVADYGKTKDERDKVTVTVENGTGGGTVPFGTEVTCTATTTDEEDKPFKCWKKSNINGDEIVSVDKTYKFKAWEDCTVTAVYEEHTSISNAMKIIIDDFAVATGVTGVMAEFIGFNGDDIDVVEKGIRFTDSQDNITKIAMTTTDNQFTVIADKPGTYVGYAILKNGEIYNLITDGLFTK